MVMVTTICKACPKQRNRDLVSRSLRYAYAVGTRIALRRIGRYTAGTRNIDNSGAVIMPPTIGAAMRCVTSEPVPEPIMTGTRPAIVTATVLTLGRTRSTAPSRIASRSTASFGVPFANRSSHGCFKYSSRITPNSAETPAKAMKPTPLATDRQIVPQCLK